MERYSKKCIFWGSEIQKKTTENKQSIPAKYPKCLSSEKTQKNAIIFFKGVLMRACALEYMDIYYNAAKEAAFA